VAEDNSELVKLFKRWRESGLPLEEFCTDAAQLKALKTFIKETARSIRTQTEGQHSADAASNRSRGDAPQGAVAIEIPGYRLVREISRGGQAVVFQGIFLKTGRKVAIKVMREGPLATEASRARFSREVQILAALNHPNIVTVLDRGSTSDSSEFFAMEFVEGESLDSALWNRRAGPSRDDPAKPLLMFLKICDAVNAAHLRGIVHRDLKPSNIRVDERGEPHVLDFGLARSALQAEGSGGANEPVTLTGQFLGSLPWASPEQAEGAQDKIDSRTDVYSLGVILYQLATGGHFPYEVVGSMRDVLNNIITAEVSPPSAIVAAREAKDLQRRAKRQPLRKTLVNPALDAIALRALAKRRDDRYQNAGELARDIESYLAGRPTVAGGLKPRGRNWKVWGGAMAAAAAVALGVGAATHFYWRSKPHEDSARVPATTDPSITASQRAATTAAQIAVTTATEPATMTATQLAMTTATEPATTTASQLVAATATEPATTTATQLAVTPATEPATMTATEPAVTTAVPTAKPSVNTSIDAAAQNPITDPKGISEEYQLFWNQLGIKTMRPWAGGADNPITSYNETGANRLMDSLPKLLQMKNGMPVTTAAQWDRRRAEIVEDLEREVYGRIPAKTPKVAWRVSNTMQGMIGSVPVVTRKLVGSVDNAGYPKVSVNIQATYTVPANTPRPVPLLIVMQDSGGTSLPSQALACGWGYGVLDLASIQRAEYAGLQEGIIGLTSKGQPRALNEWGVYRAWQWGVSRLIDYFEANSNSRVDPRKIGVAGTTISGAGALVAQAFEPRVAVGLTNSSGKGGATLLRRVFGKGVENMAGGDYCMTAGNFIKYAADTTAGTKTAADLPVDAHELIALCAPRPCLISYIKGTNSNWHDWWDRRGGFMAGVQAGPVYTLLGKKDFGTPGNFLSDPMPPIGMLIGGELAWRTYESANNEDLNSGWSQFFAWVVKYVR
jgi:serine/threonine protein kinase